VFYFLLEELVMKKFALLVLGIVGMNTGCILEGPLANAFEINQALALIQTVLELLPA